MHWTKPGGNAIGREAEAGFFLHHVLNVGCFTIRRPRTDKERGRKDIWDVDLQATYAAAKHLVPEVGLLWWLQAPWYKTALLSCLAPLWDCEPPRDLLVGMSARTSRVLPGTSQKSLTSYPLNKRPQDSHCVRPSLMLIPCVDGTVPMEAPAPALQDTGSLHWPFQLRWNTVTIVSTLIAGTIVIRLLHNKNVPPPWR
jgi:hypothetical protein